MKKTTIQRVEQKWYSLGGNGFFHAEVDENRQPFSVVNPPPNVTGQLHMGHALDNTYQDILVRWRRMQGYNTVWVPGTDHAGIATQARVEDHIRETEGKTRHDLGREEFLKRTWAGKRSTAHNSQQLRGGFVLDWERERFTMDEAAPEHARGVCAPVRRLDLPGELQRQLVSGLLHDTLRH